MESPVTVRLDAETRRKIAREAKQRRISKSEVIRRALSSYAEVRMAEDSPYEQMKDLIGVAHGGDSTLSTNTGRKFKAILEKKRKRS